MKEGVGGGGGGRGIQKKKGDGGGLKKEKIKDKFCMRAAKYMNYITHHPSTNSGQASTANTSQHTYSRISYVTSTCLPGSCPNCHTVNTAVPSSNPISFTLKITSIYCSFCTQMKHSPTVSGRTGTLYNAITKKSHFPQPSGSMVDEGKGSWWLCLLNQWDSPPVVFWNVVQLIWNNVWSLWCIQNGFTPDW